VCSKSREAMLKHAEKQEAREFEAAERARLYEGARKALRSQLQSWKLELEEGDSGAVHSGIEEMLGATEESIWGII